MNTFKGGGGFRKGGQKFTKKPKFGGGFGSGGGKKFGGRSDRSSERSEKFKATCAECGKTCEVPFRPAGDKPVYCSECFGVRLSEDNRGEKRDSRRDRPDYKQLPRSERPPRHTAEQKRSDPMIVGMQRQLNTLEEKLNRILEIINPPTPAKKVDEPVIAPTKKTVKKVAAKKVAKKAVTKAPKKTAQKVTKKK